MRRDNFRLDELKQQQLFERKQLPKQVHAEFKQQLSELKKTMGLRRTAEDREKLKKVCMCVCVSVCLGSTVFYSWNKSIFSKKRPRDH